MKKLKASDFTAKEDHATLIITCKKCGAMYHAHIPCHVIMDPVGYKIDIYKPLFALPIRYVNPVAVEHTNFSGELIGDRPKFSPVGNGVFLCDDCRHPLIHKLMNSIGDQS